GRGFQSRGWTLSSRRVRGAMLRPRTGRPVTRRLLRRFRPPTRFARRRSRIGMGKRLYVGNLPYDTDEGALRDAFGRDGRQVQSVHIVVDRDTGRPRGFAFVEMISDDDAKKAIAALDGTDFRGRMLRINEAEDRRGPARGPGGPPRSGAGGASARGQAAARRGRVAAATRRRRGRTSAPTRCRRPSATASTRTRSR